MAGGPLGVSSSIGAMGNQAKDAQLQEKIQDIWKEQPDLSFPQCLIDKLDLSELRDDLVEKADKLRARIMSRKDLEGKKKQDAEIMKQKEIEEKNKEREAKREYLAKKLEEKKRLDAKRAAAAAAANALEEDKKKVNGVVAMPQEVIRAAYSKRDIIKKGSMPNLMP